MNKAFPILFGTSTTTTTETLTWPTGLPSALYTNYGRMDVIANIKAIAGGNISLVIEEEFPTGLFNGTGPGTSFIITSQSAALTAVGQYLFTNANLSVIAGTPYASGAVGNSHLLGKGMSKRIRVIGSVTSLVVDFVLVFYSQN